MRGNFQILKFVIFLFLKIFARAPKILRLIFYYHGRAQVKFLDCAPHCAHATITEKLVIFLVLALFQKIKLRKAHSTEWARAKTFYKNQEVTFKIRLVQVAAYNSKN